MPSFLSTGLQGRWCSAPDAEQPDPGRYHGLDIQHPFRCRPSRSNGRRQSPMPLKRPAKLKSLTTKQSPRRSMYVLRHAASCGGCPMKNVAAHQMTLGRSLPQRRQRPLQTLQQRGGQPVTRHVLGGWDDVEGDLGCMKKTGTCWDDAAMFGRDPGQLSDVGSAYGVGGSTIAVTRPDTRLPRRAEKKIVCLYACICW
ncbi:hypothetical protein B0I35DRAFT_8106 [Stachybotrys elegans]|uniref:Uncharacterized protein n=1 Tax=Stachybotrys elegans TaxID=80388 RepID=A0A8K0WX36_9HYPO|nr:hypothetical protein B0I35DRAFT_8106 [Stachybotrys elegans]